MGGGRRQPPRNAAAVGCRAHTGWAALVVVAPGLKVLSRSRAELGDPARKVRRNVYQAARGQTPATAAVAVAAAERIAAEQAALALEDVVGAAGVRACAVVVGTMSDVPLESILKSHALAHAAEGRLYQQALLRGAESLGLEAVAVPKRAIWEQAESALGAGVRGRIDELRQELGPPWAEDQKLAALAGWIALSGPR